MLRKTIYVNVRTCRRHHTWTVKSVKRSPWQQCRDSIDIFVSVTWPSDEISHQFKPAALLLNYFWTERKCNFQNKLTHATHAWRSKTYTRRHATVVIHCFSFHMTTIVVVIESRRHRFEIGSIFCLIDCFHANERPRKNNTHSGLHRK